MEEKKQDALSLEEAFGELEEIITKMEQDDLPLDDAFGLYETGLKKLKLCGERLDLIEKKMQVLGSSGEITEFE